MHFQTLFSLLILLLYAGNNFCNINSIVLKYPKASPALWKPPLLLACCCCISLAKNEKKKKRSENCFFMLGTQNLTLKV